MIFKEPSMLYETVKKWRANAREEGREEGRTEGRTEGREEGRTEGREEGIRKVAKTMLKNGLDRDQIVKFTGLSRKQVESLERN
jgi:predicted transposase/invertase (TIGR01784 family)